MQMSLKTAIWLAVAGLPLLSLGGSACGSDKSVRAPSVSPLDELEILDPQVDPEGKPRSQIVTGPDGQPRLETPPTIIVHRHYYTGDRDFQGPYIPGGPMLISVHHPVTGEQCQVPVQLPPGAPRIFYRKTHITYQYRDQEIKLKFGHAGLIGQLGKPAVTLHHSAAPSVREQMRATAARQQRRDWKEQAGLNDLSGSVADSAARNAELTAKVVRTSGEILTFPIHLLRDYTPLGAVLGSD